MLRSYARLLVLAAIVTAMACSTNAAAGCTLAKIADWPVRLQRNKIIVDGTINGRKAGIVLDTGSAGP